MRIVLVFCAVCRHPEEVPLNSYVDTLLRADEVTPEGKLLSFACEACEDKVEGGVDISPSKLDS